MIRSCIKLLLLHDQIATTFYLIQFVAFYSSCVNGDVVTASAVHLAHCESGSFMFKPVGNSLNNMKVGFIKKGILFETV